MPEHTPAPTPSRSVYGFVLYLASNILLLFYMIWAIVPESWFIEMNITYLPQRYWAVAIPIFILTSFATFTFVIYPSLNLLLTPCINDLNTITDKAAKKCTVIERKNDFLPGKQGDVNFCVCKKKEDCFRDEYVRSYKNMSKYNVPMVQDLDINYVSELLYLKK